MTDAEKELRRLAQAVPSKSHMGMPEVKAYLEASMPGTVLALLDRIEALEKFEANVNAHHKAMADMRDEFNREEDDQ